jgi:hypothetical protein
MEQRIALFVIVAPHGAPGRPEMARARAFMVPGDTAIC